MAKFKDFCNNLTCVVLESKSLAPETITLNPERDDSHDVIDKLMPFLLKQAYHYLLIDKNNHERKYGPHSTEEDSFNFDFTEDNLLDELDSVIHGLVTRLEGQTTSDRKEMLDRLKSSFPEPLN